MKVIPFNVPRNPKEAFRLQVDRLPHLYDKLHQHHEAQIMFIEKSEGTLIAGDYVGRFAAGDLYLIGSELSHVFRNDESYFKSATKRPAHAVSIYFDENFAGESFWNLNDLNAVRQLLERSKLGFRIEGATKLAVIALIKGLSSQKGFERLMGFFKILQILSESTEVIKLAMTSGSTSLHVGEGKRMNDILQFTFNESHRKIYIEEVAALANLSVEAFCRYFKLHTLKTYTSFLNEVRISKACHLLISTEKTIHEICYDSGFNNLSHFNRVFKKITGKTPKAYLYLPG